VLLKSAENSRGFEAKVADFGLSRQLGIESRVQSNKYGTVTHCPPELLMDGTVSKVKKLAACSNVSSAAEPAKRSTDALPGPACTHALCVQSTRMGSGATLEQDVHFAKRTSASHSIVRPAQAVDSWAFGVLLWEMYHGSRAWAGLAYPQACRNLTAALAYHHRVLHAHECTANGQGLGGRMACCMALVSNSAGVWAPCRSCMRSASWASG
jgi:serine/threonine protein kinase